METKRHLVSLKQYRKLNGKWQFVPVARDANGDPSGPSSIHSPAAGDHGKLSALGCDLPRHFRWWQNWALRSRLQPMIDAARMPRRFENIVTYLRHRISNAASESIYAKIQSVKYTAGGFRSKENFIHAIYTHCGGLDLAPLSH